MNINHYFEYMYININSLLNNLNYRIKKYQRRTDRSDKNRTLCLANAKQLLSKCYANAMHMHPNRGKAMQTRDVEALIKAVEGRGFKPGTDREKHVLGMARQSVAFKRELKWPESMELQGIYRRVYAD